jgi:hypothetical protein
LELAHLVKAFARPKNVSSRRLPEMYPACRIPIALLGTIALRATLRPIKPVAVIAEAG